MSTAVTASPDNFDKVWDDGIADWRANGADEIIAERQTKYAEYIASSAN